MNSRFIKFFNFYLFGFFVFIQMIFFQKTFADQKKEETKTLIQNQEKTYSFRPLLIQGKKRMIQKTRDMKIETGTVVESKLFFIEIDLKKRIFDTEVMK